MGKDKERFTLPVAVFLMLAKNNEVLLSRRYNTGWQDGKYGLIAGHIDGSESLTEALCREAREEAGIIIEPQDAKLVHLAHHSSNKEYLYVFFEVKIWQGTPTIQEPDKCDAMEWFALKSLPDNLVPETKLALEAYRQKITYSETGW